MDNVSAYTPVDHPRGLRLSSTGLSSDVIVIGGGPGGSTTATMLARQGARVLLLERERFPRDHVGESLLPASIPVLEELGVLPAVEQAGFLTKWGATMVWGKDRTPWSWYFKETNQRYPHSYQVWRPQFDLLLLDNSRAAGVDVREGHRVSEVVFDGGRATGVIYEAGDGSRRTASAGFVVDASGQGGLLSHQLKMRQWDSFFRNLAVYAYFDGFRSLPDPNQTNIFIESYANGWLWAIPLHTGWASVGAVVDSSRSQGRVQRAGPLEFLMEQISQAPETAQMLREAKLTTGPSVVKDWSYVSQRLVGDGYVLVGDAACFVDPLFSSGVHLSLMSGVLAAAYVTSALKDTGLRSAAAQVYQEMYLEEYNQFREMAKLFYSSNLSVDSYFWEARRLADGSSDFSPRHAFIRAVAGQPPRGYERAVLDRGLAPPDFVASVGAVEADRAQRQAWVATFQAGADGADSLLRRTVPRLATGVTVARKPVVGQGEFVWGYVVITPGHPQGTQCSSLVARLVSLIDGRASVCELLDRLGDGADRDQGTLIESAVLASLKILYVEGAIEELQTP